MPRNSSPPSRAHEPQVQTCFASDPQCQTAKEQPTRSKRPAIDHSRFSSFSRGQETGGAERIRTDDPLLAKQVLSQLSYSPIRLAAAKAIEPSLSIWWAREDLNFRPHAYQARALTN